MEDKELMRIVTGFRSGVLGRRTPKAKCFIVCAPLHQFLKGCGVKNEIVQCAVTVADRVWFHYFLKLEDGRIIDPTASQFKDPKGDPMPKVFLGNQPNWYMPLKKKVKNDHFLNP